MTQAEKVEFVRRHRKCRSVTINGSESVCLNCIWYEQYYWTGGHGRRPIKATVYFMRSSAARLPCPARSLSIRNAKRKSACGTAIPSGAKETSHH